MKKMCTLAALFAAISISASAQDYNAYYADYKRPHTYTEVVNFSDLHKGMTEDLATKDYAQACNSMLDELGSPGTGGVFITDDQGSQFVDYFSAHEIKNLMKNGQGELIDASDAGEFYTRGWKKGEKGDQYSWFKRSQRPGEKFWGFSLGKVRNIRALTGVYLLPVSTTCGNASRLIKNPLPQKRPRDNDYGYVYQNPVPACIITDFSVWPQKPKYGETAELSCTLKGNCKDNVDFYGGSQTITRTSPTTAQTGQLYAVSTFTVMAYDQVTGESVSRSLTVYPVQVQDADNSGPNYMVIVPEDYSGKKKTWLGRNWGWMVPATAVLIGGAIYGGYSLSHHQSGSSPNPNPGQNTNGGPSNVPTVL